jgi:hypothetical protein
LNFKRTFRHFFILQFEHRLDCYLDEILEAVLNKLAVVNYLKKITDKDLLCPDMFVRTRVGESRIVLVAASEH